MKSSATNEFWRHYASYQDLSGEQRARPFRIWQADPRASALRFKRVRDVYSVRIGNTGYRAVAVDVPGGFLWIWIGRHDEYQRLLKR